MSGSVADVLEAARRGRIEPADNSVYGGGDDVHIESHVFDPATATASAQSIVALCLALLALALLALAIHTVWAAYRRSTLRPPAVPPTRAGQRALERRAQQK